MDIKATLSLILIITISLIIVKMANNFKNFIIIKDFKTINENHLLI